jgi:hypothetical protein
MQKALLAQVKAAEFYLHMYRPAHTTDAIQIRYIDTGPTRYLHARAFAYRGYISHGRSALSHNGRAAFVLVPIK